MNHNKLKADLMYRNHTKVNYNQISENELCKTNLKNGLKKNYT